MQLIAEAYELIDDKLRILTAVKRIWGAPVTTGFPRQGHDARGPEALAGNPPADFGITSIGDRLDYDLPALLGAATSVSAARRRDGCTPVS